MLELKNVSKFYYNKGLVSSGITKVNLMFNMGEFVAITGESGSGKSTLLNVISGLDTYDEGQMYINGEETSHYSEEDYEEYRRKYVGNIFQYFNLVSSYTVYQNVELVLLLNGEVRKDVKSKVNEILKKVDLYKYRNTKVSKLSGGMKQRVAIARCLAKDTPIIIADEPTGNLDSKNAKSVLKLLHDISKDKLVIVVTHNYDQISEYATRKIKMHDGRVVESVNLKESSVVKEVKVSPINKIKLISKLRLGIRNTFNIPIKFLLLMFVYLFVIFSIANTYSTNEEEDTNTNVYNSFYNDKDIKSRILVKKRDNSSFTNEEINNIKNTTNVKSVILNDLIYDYYTMISNDNDIYISGAYLKVSDLNIPLTYGTVPVNTNEIVIETGDYNFFTEDYENIINSELIINVNEEIIKVKVTGLIVKEDTYYSMSNVYVSDSLYDYIYSMEMRACGTTEAVINSVNTGSIIRVSDKVKEGETYISESASYSCKTNNCSNDTLNLSYSNMYYSTNLDLKISNLYNNDNFKKLFNSDYNGENIIYLNINDYQKLYNDNKVYQISVFMNDYRDSSVTKDKLNEYSLYIFKDNNEDTLTSQILKIINSSVLLILVIVLFFISYFVIKLIINSRNKYFVTIRILGGSLKDVKSLLVIELLNIVNIVYIIFVIISILVKNSVINVEYFNKMMYHINLKEYVLLYVILSIMSYLIVNRYSRKVFKSSVITTYNMEV